MVDEITISDVLAPLTERSAITVSAVDDRGGHLTDPELADSRPHMASEDPAVGVERAQTATVAARPAIPGAVAADVRRPATGTDTPGGMLARKEVATWR